MPRHYPSKARMQAFSLMELLIVVTLISLMATLAIPAYNGYVDRARVTSAIGDMGRIALEIEKFKLNNNEALPLTLNDIDVGGMLDPWGNPYSYLNISTVKGKGSLRKDKNLNPLNSDYDLYSKGADGETKKPLQPKVSHDDVIRANNGAYMGLAENY